MGNHGIISKTLIYVQLFTEDGIYRIDYKTNNLMRSVPNPKIFTDFRVIRFKELLIEMHQRIFSVVAHNTLHFCDPENGNQILNNPFNTTMKVGQCKMFENLFQKRIAGRYQFGCFL